MGHNFQQLSYYATLTADMLRWTGTENTEIGRIYDELPPVGFSYGTFAAEIAERYTDLYTWGGGVG